MGKAAEGLNSAHQQKKLGDEALKEVRDRFNIQISDEEIKGLTFRKPAPDSEEMKYFLERRAALGGYLPARTDVGSRAGRPAAGSLQCLARRHRRSRDFHHHGAGAHPDHVDQGQERRQAHRAHRARRGAHLRHGRYVPPSRHLFFGGTAVHAAGCRPADVLSRGQAGPDSGRGHQRSREPVFVAGGGDGVRESRRQHDSLLYLLLDVRLPARGRFHLGGSGQSGAGFLGGRHRRPYHARRRRSAASGRTQPLAGEHGAQLRFVRSHLCL
jgi:hypothetical protein